MAPLSYTIYFLETVTRWSENVNETFLPTNLYLYPLQFGVDEKQCLGPLHSLVLFQLQVLGQSLVSMRSCTNEIHE